MRKFTYFVRKIKGKKDKRKLSLQQIWTKDMNSQVIKEDKQKKTNIYIYKNIFKLPGNHGNANCKMLRYYSQLPP